MAEATTREELQAVLRKRTSWVDAVRQGLRLAARTAVIGLPTTLAFAALSGALSAVVVDAAKAVDTLERPTLELVNQVFVVTGVLATIYGVIQITKRERASRQSWWPSLLAIPCLLVATGLTAELAGVAYGPVVLTLVLLAWGIVFYTFAGAALHIVWLRAGADALDGRPIRAGEIFGEAARRMLEVAGPHGAKVHALSIGGQLVLPGVLYALQYAFVDQIVVLDPDRPALARSGQLAFGMKGRLFRLLLAWWLLGMVVFFAIAAVMQDVTTFEKLVALVSTFVVDPSVIQSRTFAVQEVFWSLITWVFALSMLVLYREREAQVRAKTALKKMDAAAAAPPPVPGQG